MRAKLLALVAGLALALTATTPAHSATWNGNNFDFGFGQDWEFTNFYLYDVDLNSTSVDFTQPATVGASTDIWDTAAQMLVSSETLGFGDQIYQCADDSDIDITEVDGNLHIDCTTDFTPAIAGEVSIRGHIMIYGPEGDLVRFALEITNNSDSTISDITVGTNTNFGSAGDIWGYQNYDETVLPVPASEDNDNSAAIEETNSNWLVNIDGGDPSGSLAWGHANGSVDVSLTETNGDGFWTDSDAITVAAGETVWVAFFIGWDPANLNTLGYPFGSGSDASANADAVVQQSAEFNSFSGRLAAGLPAGANVVNWAAAPESEGLAPTGVDNWSIWAGLGLLVAGVAGRAIRRRVHA